MFNSNTLQEIYSSLMHNKLRTLLTGLSVSWGIFILIILLGAGNGLKNGVMSNFGERAINTIEMYSGRSSMPFQGLKANRDLPFTNKQTDVVEAEVPEAGAQTAIVDKQLMLTNGNEYGSFTVKGVKPVYDDIFKLKFELGNGRFLNELDLKNNGKVIVIDQKIEEVLFKNKNALGSYIKVAGVMFKVIGINTKKSRFQNSVAFIPFSTAQLIFNPNRQFNNIAFEVNGLETNSQNEEFNERLRSTMARSLRFDKADQSAIWIFNAQREYVETMKIFGGITMFVTIIGIFTLIAGIVGVSNIMLVTVRERTREIGIRKALGAPPSSILSSIIIESIMITTLFGYLGMMFGIGITEIINFVMEQSAAKNPSDTGMSVFKNPTVPLLYVFVSTVILIISGIIAGYMPARRAVGIKPIEAMREE